MRGGRGSSRRQAVCGMIARRWRGCPSDHRSGAGDYRPAVEANPGHPPASDQEIRLQTAEASFSLVPLDESPAALSPRGRILNSPIGMPRFVPGSSNRSHPPQPKEKICLVPSAGCAVSCKLDDPRVPPRPRPAGGWSGQSGRSQISGRPSTETRRSVPGQRHGGPPPSRTSDPKLRSFRTDHHEKRDGISMTPSGFS